MKTTFKLPKIIKLLMLIALVSTGVSCNDKNDKKHENKGTFDGSNSCELITADNIRSVFNLKDGMEIEQTKKLKEICYYKWQSPTQDSLRYSVRFTFSRWEQKSASDVKKTWQSQNKSVYNDRNLQKVSGVGDNASWSDQDKGQLRVTEDGYFFYISIYVKPTKKDPMETQEKIDKASALAKYVIKSM